MSNTIYSDKIKVNCLLVHDEDGFYHLVYKITNAINRKIYIGKHSTKDPYDDYMGSGLRIWSAIKKYGIENFTKEILFCFNKENDAFLKESEIVNQEFIDRDDTYNITLGGKGWQKGVPLKEETKIKISNSLKGKMAGEKNPSFGKPSAMRGKHLSKETRDKISKAKMGEKNPNFGKPGTMCGKKHKPETREKLSRIAKERVGKRSTHAKAVLKLDENNNVITEYGTVKECCELECIYGKLLRRLIKEHILYNGFYFEFKPKN